MNSRVEKSSREFLKICSFDKLALDVQLRIIFKKILEFYSYYWTAIRTQIMMVSYFLRILFSLFYQSNFATFWQIFGDKINFQISGFLRSTFKFLVIRGQISNFEPYELKFHFLSHLVPNFKFRVIRCQILKFGSNELKFHFSSH